MPKQKKRPVIINILLAICYILIILGILICLIFFGALIVNLIGPYDLFAQAFLYFELFGIVLVFFGAMGTYLIHIYFYPDVKKSR